MRRLSSLLLAGCVLASCSGGTQSSPVSLSTPSRNTAGSSVTVRVIVPPKTETDARHPQYVSPSTRSIAVTVTPGGATATANCSTPGPCSVSVNAPSGSDTFAISLYDGLNGTGAVLSGASTTQTITPGQLNVVSVTFIGTIASVGFPISGGAGPSLASLPFMFGRPNQSATIYPGAFDADGNVIVEPGNYAAPLNISDGDTTGAFTLSGPSTYVAPSPQPQNMVTYNGSTTVTSANITLSATGVPSDTLHAIADTGPFIFAGGRECFLYGCSTTSILALSTATSAAYQFTGNFLYAAAGPNRSTYGSSGAGDISYFASTLGPATTTITDANGNVQGLATDSAGNVYAAIAGATNEIDEFAPGLPSSTPTRSVVVSSAPFSVALDGSGNIYVQESGQVEIYPANATLHTPPTTTLGGTNTGLPATAGPQQIGVDAAGDIFAVVSFFSTVEIGVFRAGAQSGNVGPSPTIQLNTPNITNAYLAPVLTVSGTTLYASVNGFAAHGDEYVVTLPTSSSGTITPANSYLYGAEDPTIWSLSIGT